MKIAAAFMAGGLTALLLSAVVGWWWAMLLTPAMIYAGLLAALVLTFACALLFDLVESWQLRQEAGR